MMAVLGHILLMMKFRTSQNFTLLYHLCTFFPLLCTIPMPNPPLKKQKPSIIEVLDKAKSFIHEHNHKLESSNSESSYSSSSDDTEILELPDRPEADANAIDQEEPDAKYENGLLPSPPLTVSKKRKHQSKTKAICEC
jgi:hypothetical protein